MTDLLWFPYDTEEWERRVRALGLSCFDEGALMRLLRGAWRAENPCTVLDAPDDLARLVGSEWKKATRIYREQFAPLADEPGRRRCEWLYDIYLRQLDKHISYQSRGGRGGRARSTAPPKPQAQLEAQLEPQLQAQLQPQLATLSRESTAEAFSCAPTEHTAKSPPMDIAPAPGGAALATGQNGNGDYQQRPADREALRRLGHRPDPLDEPIVPGSRAALEAARQERQERYDAELWHAADGWMALYPAETKEIGRAARQALNLPAGELPQFKLEMLRAEVIAAIRKRCSWPTIDEWDGESELQLQDTDPSTTTG